MVKAMLEWICVDVEGATNATLGVPNPTKSQHSLVAKHGVEPAMRRT